MHGSLRLYGARVSLLGKAFDSRDFYRTRKEAKNRVASRAVDFLEGWEQGRGSGFDLGLNLAATLPHEHAVLTEDRENYGPESFFEKDADLTTDVLVKKAVRLVAFFPLGNKFYVYQLAVKLARSILEKLKRYSSDITTTIVNKLIDVIGNTLDDYGYEIETDFQPMGQLEDVVLAGKALRAAELFAEQAVYIAARDQSMIPLECNSFDVAKGLIDEVFQTFTEDLAEDFARQLQRALFKCLQRRKESEAQADRNGTQRSAVPESRSQPEMAQNQTLVFPIRTRLTPWDSAISNPDNFSAHKRKADTDEDPVTEVQQKIRRQ